jgi:hypothetical protein
MEATSLVQRDSRLCSAHNREGQLCRKYAMRGQNVCRNHSGNSPQAIAKAERMIEIAELRIRGLALRNKSYSQRQLGHLAAYRAGKGGYQAPPRN